jgi:phosphoribosylaminoimidazolecarboxamide formyltransferase / IMP cyclohydrolase
VLKGSTVPLRSVDVPRALISVFDKSGVVEFAQALVSLGFEVVSSGGTARTLAAAGVPVIDVAELTGFAPILGHRVVTLHPAVHAGLLADRDNPEHVADLERMGIEPFDVVAVNLYPFTSQPGIELIDVGGPTMVRAAAKNHQHVAVITSPARYHEIIEHLRANTLDVGVRRQLARDAFAHTAAYDADIVTWFDEVEGETLPTTLHLTLERAETLRYGENPHQSGARYSLAGTRSWWDASKQLQGKALSYLNVFDADAAWRLVGEFDGPAAVVVKHANPCGVSVADTVLDAVSRALDCDRTSAFGGIVGINHVVDAATATVLADIFLEVVIAPGFTAEAVSILGAKANLRVIEAGQPVGNDLELRSVDGGFLVQEPDVVALDRAQCTVPTAAQPSEPQWRELEFAWQVCGSVSSNAIVITHDAQAVGIGAGQQNRLDSARIAIEKAGLRAFEGAAASDAFFPFRDGVDALAAAGVTAIIQPGGSIRDAESVEACNEHNIVMIFTGKRHFRH